MSYMLVLQWPASSIKDYDALIEIETALENRLPSQHKVDGHDAGAGEMNIFIFTADPTAAFQEVQRILGTRDFWADARVAYRKADGDKYTILWPPGLTEFTVK